MGRKLLLGTDRDAGHMHQTGRCTREGGEALDTSALNVFRPK